MSVCSADRFPERDPILDYDRSELAKVHREDLKAYLGACGGRVLLGDLQEDVPHALGLDDRYMSRLVFSAMTEGMLDIRGLTAEVVLLDPIESSSYTTFGEWDSTSTAKQN